MSTPKNKHKKPPGKEIDPADFRRKSSVVWQSDVLLPCATVSEALMTSALHKLPQAMPRRDKQRRVEQILTELELQAVKHSRIGQDIDGASSGISGGERRRVSVGIGLVTDAAVLFLDEPTTGGAAAAAQGSEEMAEMETAAASSPEGAASGNTALGVTPRAAMEPRASPRP